MKRNNSNSKLAQFKAAVAHLPFTEFNETSDGIVAIYETKRNKTNPVAVTVVVTYSPNLKGTSCNFFIYRNDIQTDSYGCYDIDEFVEQLEPYFNLGNEVSLLKQLDRRLTKLEMYNNLAQQELNSDSEQELIELLDKGIELVDIANELEDSLYKEGFVAALTMLGVVDSNYTKLGYGALGVSRVKELELDELSKVGYVKRKDGKLIKRKLVL